MNDDANEEKWNEMLRDLARDYNQPPMIVPREAMWAAIVAGQRRGRPRILEFSRRFAPLAAAAVIVLAVGIGIGRVSISHPTATPIASNSAANSATPTAVPEAYAIATTQQLLEVQALLTAFDANNRQATGNADATRDPKASAKADAKADAHLASWARDLLSNTRLLLDSPAGADPHRRQLLEDLELVLVQIAALSPDAAASDRAAIAHTLDDAQVLPRIKAAIPTNQNQVGL
jgi:hypothetical protein